MRLSIYHKVETEAEIVFTYRTIYSYLAFIAAITVFLYFSYFRVIFYVLGVPVVIIYLIASVRSTKYSQVVKNELEAGNAKVLGSRYSFTNPLKFVIKKDIR